MATHAADVRELAAQLEREAAREPAALGVETRLQAAQALERRYPALAREIAGRAVSDLKAGRNWVGTALVQALAAVAPGELAVILPLFDPPAPHYRVAIRMLEQRGEKQMADALRSAVPPADVAKPRAAAPGETVRTISARMRGMRGEATKEQRGALAAGLAAEIRQLPARPEKLSFASALSNLSTEGDIGREALEAVTATLALSVREVHPLLRTERRVWDYGSDYLRLAELVRYEGLKLPFQDPSVAARITLLAVRDAAKEGLEWTLTGLDGKAYSLQQLRGRIVLLNFWATWCPPCRKEMPDLDTLFKRYRAKGLVVLAISDEERDIVAKFLADKRYSFPVLLDAGRKVHEMYGVEGIPKTFAFDREGRLASQAIDMRTSEQFMTLLKKAGLN